jgi:hypothetical protein
MNIVVSGPDSLGGIAYNLSNRLLASSNTLALAGRLANNPWSAMVREEVIWPSFMTFLRLSNPFSHPERPSYKKDFPDLSR